MTVTITTLYRIINGVMRPYDISSGILNVGTLYVGSSSPEALTKAILANLITLQNGSDAGSLHIHDARYVPATTLAAIGGASLVGYTGTGRVFTASDTAVQTAIDSLDSALDTVTLESTHLITLTGVAANAVDLGLFVGGTTISDNTTIKNALAQLEIAVELRQPIIGAVLTVNTVAVTASTNNVSLTTANIPENIAHLYYTDARAVAANASAFSTTDGHVTNLAAALGVSVGDATMVVGGAFTGATLTGQTIAKAAIQALGTAVDLRALDSVVVKTVNSKSPSSGAVTLNTDDVAESGSPTNKYFTDSRARAAITILDTATIDLTYSGGQISADVKSTSITDGMLAGSISDGKLSSSFVHLGGDTMTGELILNADPVHALGAVTKQYADTIASGFNPHASVAAGTIAPLPACTPAGSMVGKSLTANAVGVLMLDGYTPAQYDRLLIKNQVNPIDNGIYTLTTVNDAFTAFILVRATDSDGAPSYEVQPGDFTFVNHGTTLAGSQWTVVGVAPLVVDTSSIVWTQINAATSVQAGLGLSSIGTTFNVNVDGSTLEIDGGNALKVKAGGITATQIASATITASQIANATITATQIANATITATQIANATITATQIVDYTITGIKLADSVAGDGIIHNVTDHRLDLDIASSSGLALSASDGSGKLDVALNGTTPGLVKANGLAIDWASSASDAKAWKASALSATPGAGLIGYDHTASGLAATTVKAAIDEVNGRVTSLTSSAVSETVADANITGFAASGLFAVRNAIVANSETAGIFHPADKAQGISTVTDLFWAIGILSYTLGAGGLLVTHGTCHAPSHGFAIGRPIFLAASGAMSSTPPSTDGDATVVMGVPRDANYIDVGIKQIGIYSAT